MSYAVMPESVRVYLSGRTPAGTPAAERAQAMGRFVGDSIRSYMECEGMEIPDAATGTPAFVYGAHGKPFLAHHSLAGLYFSLSHTREIAVCAVADREVGCDVEQPCARGMDAERYVNIAKRFFAPDEYECLTADPARAFFPIWTKKEAYVKWTGRGLSQGFSSFSVFHLPERVVCENVTVAGADDAVCAVCYAREM